MLIWDLIVLTILTFSGRFVQVQVNLDVSLLALEFFSTICAGRENFWGLLEHGFFLDRMFSCHPAINFKALKGTQRTDPYLWPGCILSLSTTRLHVEGALFPLRWLASARTIRSSHCLWNQLHFSLCQPHSGTSSSISYSPIPSSITSSSSDSPLCTPVTPSLFHSRLKTYLFHKFYPP